uniref:FYVE, RhoGEF and PH domain-containing protein 6 n=1 Tax=Lygus hesperus TaxID=30085 RepID=A0A0A9Y6A8_LYGHE
MTTAPSTPTLSLELKALIMQRNVLTSRSKSRVLKSLDQHINEDKASRQAELKAKAIEEIFSSEASYLNTLEIAMKFFKTPVLESNLKIPEGLKTLFDNLESLYNVNGELLNELKKHGEDVAKAFITVAPFFKLYSVYAYDYRQGIAVLQEIPKTNCKLDALIKRQESRPEVGMKLGSLLIAPIQRVPRYRLLLKELISHTPPSSSQYANILEAIRLIETATEHINSLVCEQENMQRIIELQKSLCGGRPTLVHPGRRLIKEGVLMKVSKKGKKAQPRYFVLMSDVLMYCKMTGVPLGEPNSLRCSCVVPLRKCAVKHVLSDKVFSVTCLSLSLILFSDEPYISDSWVTALNQTIDQEEQGRLTLHRRGSSRQPLRKKELNVLTETLTPRKRKQQQEDIDDICLPFHSPWKRNKMASHLPSIQPTSSLAEVHSKRPGYLSSIKKAISNFGQSIQKYWIPIYTGRETQTDRRITHN